jgi:class 3 adenylate cyclase
MDTTGPRTSRLIPRNWPIAVKLALALVVAALVPMLIVSYYNAQTGMTAMAGIESKKLAQLAQSIGGRIDQLIKDTRHTISYLGWSEEAIRLVTSPTEEERVLLHDKMSRLTAANRDLELLMVLDEDGKVIASTKPNYIGRKLDFRDYFKEAVRGGEYVSDIEVGTASNSAGMYFSTPVRNLRGRIAGVAVLKLKESTIASIMEQSRGVGASLTTFLVDADGVVIHHPDRKRILYRSLAPLPDARLKTLIDEKRFGMNVTSIPSLELTDLADALLGSRDPGFVRYTSPISRAPEIAGFAPLSEKDWRIVVSESEEVFSKPLNRMFNNALSSVALVGLIFIVIGFAYARTFTRRIKLLASSARAIESGDYEHAKVTDASQDELGRFAATFNAMIDGVKARQRERDIFGRLVSPEVREKLLTGDLKLGGENLRVSVLFSDIRGFSTMSEKMSPQDVVALLNEYLTEMTDAVRPYGGYVNNFIGDAIVVVFGAPDARAECEWSALSAARSMRERLDALNRRRKEMDDPPLKTGIGITTGKVVAGQIGSLERFMYTVIGDTVNVAARLEELTKQYPGNPILLNASTFEGCRHRLHDGQYQDLGMVNVKGKAEPVHVYAVDAPA